MGHPLNWELHVLSRAVAFKNLSSASSHVGVSQPQLSRIIAKIEETYELELLDRSSKRNSLWTDHAFDLVEFYRNTTEIFASQVQSLRKPTDLQLIRIGTLEGLSEEALKIVKKLFQLSQSRQIEVIVDDLAGLEERYFNKGLEILITSREPGKAKPDRSIVLGYQTFSSHSARDAVPCLSPFEVTSQKAKAAKGNKSDSKSAASRSEKILVSNSLRVKEMWIHQFGGAGQVPSAVKKKALASQDEQIAVLAIALPHFPDTLWSGLFP